MCSINRLMVLLTTLVLIAAGEKAFSQEIDQPHTSRATTITATCTEISSGKKLEISGMRLFDGDEFINSINFRIGETYEQITFTDIKSITLSDGSDPDGYVEAKLVRSQGPPENSARMRIKQNNKILSLKGSMNNRSGVSIDLNKCRSVEFSSVAAQTDSDQNRIPDKK
jgi:hypothetical protein